MEKSRNIFKSLKLSFKVSKIIIQGSEVFQISFLLISYSLQSM